MLIFLHYTYGYSRIRVGIKYFVDTYMAIGLPSDSPYNIICSSLYVLRSRYLFD